MNGNMTSGQWPPVWWFPVIYDGAVWAFTATLTGAKPGDIRGGALFVNGEEFPIEATDELITFEVSEEDVARIPHRAPCSLYIDHAHHGRYLWLNGHVTKGGTGHDSTSSGISDRR